MNYQLNIRMKKAEGSLVRLLGVVQRRGYDVVSLAARLDAEGKAHDIQLVFRPIATTAEPDGRPPEILERMVRRLYDVEFLEFTTEIQAQPSAKPPTNGSKRSASKPKVAKE